MWSGVHAAAEAHDHPHRTARDYVVEVQRMMISETTPVEDRVKVGVLSEDPAHLDADLGLQGLDGVCGAYVVDRDRLTGERLDEDLYATVEATEVGWKDSARLGGSKTALHAARLDTS